MKLHSMIQRMVQGNGWFGQTSPSSGAGASTTLHRGADVGPKVDTSNVHVRTCWPIVCSGWAFLPSETYWLDCRLNRGDLLVNQHAFLPTSDACVACLSKRLAWKLWFAWLQVSHPHLHYVVRPPPHLGRGGQVSKTIKAELDGSTFLRGFYQCKYFHEHRTRPWSQV
eukprot:1679883-Amphidinium_carterae.1